MFFGSSYLNLDAKSRFAMPKKYRETIVADHGGEMVLTADHGGKCLSLYPMSSWELMKNSIIEMNPLEKGVKNLMRTVFGYATEIKMDGQGRILVAEPLRDFAQFDKKLMLIGQLDKFELWSEEVWKNNAEERVVTAEESIQKMPIAKKRKSAKKGKSKK